MDQNTITPVFSAHVQMIGIFFAYGIFGTQGIIQPMLDGIAYFFISSKWLSMYEDVMARQ